MRTLVESFLNALYDENQGLRSLLTSTEPFVDAHLAPIFWSVGQIRTSGSGAMGSAKRQQRPLVDARSDQQDH